MNKFVTGALAFAAAGSLASAGNGTSDWLELDKEIGDLASSLRTDSHGPNIGGLLRAFYDEDSEDMTLDETTLWVETSSGDFWGRLSGSFAGAAGGGQAFGLDDAYVGWSCGDNFNMTWGQFRPFVTRSGSMDTENIFFRARNRDDAGARGTDTGIGLNGSSGSIGWALSYTTDAGPDDETLTARVEYHVNGGCGLSQSGSSEGLAATIGVGIQDSDAAETMAIDAYFTMDQFWGSIETVDDDTDDDTAIAVGMAVNDAWNVGIRLQEDDGSGDETTSIAAHHGVNGGFWTIDYTETETGGVDTESISVGLTVGASRSAAHWFGI